MKKTLSLGVLAAAVALSACSKKPEEAAAVQSAANGEMIVRIGHAAPLTGPQPIWARTMKTASGWRLMN